MRDARRTDDGRWEPGTADACGERTARPSWNDENGGRRPRGGFVTKPDGGATRVVNRRAGESDCEKGGGLRRMPTGNWRADKQGNAQRGQKTCMRFRFRHWDWERGKHHTRHPSFPLQARSSKFAASGRRKMRKSGRGVSRACVQHQPAPAASTPRPSPQLRQSSQLPGEPSEEKLQASTSDAGAGTRARLHPSDRAFPCAVLLRPSPSPAPRSIRQCACGFRARPT
ncbi:hypothetical protein C8Q76DRAFT_5019 [Earliella scabrosa]|nr:hypothetical protein C8Q76DRAFT_5019 [Earliella scabrosa]